MSDFRIPLNPQANPTNQFVAPNIRPPSGQAASDLAQLGQALGQVVPELNRVFSRRDEAHIAASQAQARQDFLQKRYQNTKELKAAVDRGEIAQTDNPWYMVQLRQDVAANEASERVRQMQVDWENSPVRFSDNPEEVEQWAQQQLAPATDGRDAYESEAVGPVVQQGTAQLVGRHMEVRRSERADERVANFTARVSQVLQGHDPLAASQQLQLLIDDARLTMPGAQVNAMVVAAASEAAEVTGDEAVLAPLASIKNLGAGGTLADDPRVMKLQQDLPLMRMRRTRELDRELQLQEKARQEAAKESLLGQLMQANGNDPAKVRITPELAAQWGLSFKDTIEINEASIRYGETQAGESDKQAALVDKKNARLAKTLQGSLQADLTNGTRKINDPEVTDTATLINTLDPDAGNAFNRFLSDFYSMQGWDKRVFARESDPVIYSDLFTRVSQGQLTTKDILPNASKLSSEDFKRLIHETSKPEGATKLASFPMSTYEDILKDMIVWPAKDTDGKEFLTVADAEKDPNVASRYVRAKAKFQETVAGRLNNPEFAKLPRDAQTAEIRKILDQTAVDFGGVTDADRGRIEAERKQKGVQATKDAEVLLRPEITTVDGVTDLGNGKKVGTTSILSDKERVFIRDLKNSLVPDLAPLEKVVSDPAPSLVWGPTERDYFGNPIKRNPTDLALRAFVWNARAKEGGGWQGRGALALSPSGSLAETSRWTGTTDTDAKILYEAQRSELATIRQNIESQYINPKTQAELMSLAKTLSAQKASGREVEKYKLDRFTELERNYRLYDFLSVTAGVEFTNKSDYRDLYKYPAAANAEGLRALLPLIASKAPKEEIGAIMEAQAGLIHIADETLKNVHYQP